MRVLLAAFFVLTLIGSILFTILAIWTVGPNSDRLGGTAVLCMALTFFSGMGLVISADLD